MPFGLECMDVAPQEESSRICLSDVIDLSTDTSFEISRNMC
jgi:hypothetical protein